MRLMCFCDVHRPEHDRECYISLHVYYILCSDSPTHAGMDPSQMETQPFIGADDLAAGWTSHCPTSASCLERSGTAATLQDEEQPMPKQDMAVHAEVPQKVPSMLLVQAPPQLSEPALPAHQVPWLRLFLTLPCL